MIPIDCLRAIRRIIVHKQCADGRASALIARAALPDVPIVEMAYGDPAHEALQPEPGLCFLDFSPPKKRLPDFVSKNGVLGFIRGEPGAIVLDHHASEFVAPFGELGVFGDNAKAESGAALALREILAPLRGPAGSGYVPDGRWKEATHIARLAAIRDTWQRSDEAWNDACALSAALVFPLFQDLLAMGIVRFAEMARDLGPMLLAKRREEAANAAVAAVRMTVAGQRVAVIPSLSLTSDVADLLAAETDVVAGFEYVHEAGRVRLQFSLRSRGGVDVSAIARRYGGGGHKAAAGFAVPIYVEEPGVVPYEKLRFLLEKALAS